MERYRILSLDAKDIYENEIKNGEEVGYLLPEKKDEKYYKKFKRRRRKANEITIKYRN